MANNWRDWISKSENQKLVANLGLGAMGAMGAKGDRDFQRQQVQQGRADTLQDKQRNAYLDRATEQNNIIGSNMDDDYRNANSVAELTDPFKYKRELQRDTNRAMMLGQAAKMLGMPTSGLFNSMNSDDAIVRRNASAVMGNEMNASDISPGRSARDINSLLGMNPLSSAVAPQNRQLAQYASGKNQGLASTRDAMMGNVNTAYDKFDKSIGDQIAAGGKEIDPNTGKPKTSKWRKILGATIKYGGAAALMATGVGAPAAAAILAGTSLAGDKIAGKGWKEAALGAGLAAIPGGGSAVGAGLTSGIKNQALQQFANQGIRAAADNIPYVGAGLSVANASGMLPKAIGNTVAQNVGSGRVSPMMNNLYRPAMQGNRAGLFASPKVNVRF
jgi:hypothetical protein